MVLPTGSFLSSPSGFQESMFNSWLGQTSSPPSQRWNYLWCLGSLPSLAHWYFRDPSCGQKAIVKQNFGPSIGCLWIGKSIYQRKDTLLWIKTKMNTQEGRMRANPWPTDSMKGICHHIIHNLYFLTIFFFKWLPLNVVDLLAALSPLFSYLDKYLLPENNSQIIYTPELHCEIQMSTWEVANETDRKNF